MVSFQEEFANRIYDNPNFQQDVNYLLRYYLGRFLNDDENPNIITTSRVKRLAESAVIMASSPNEIHKRTSFELAALLFESRIQSLNAIPGVTRLVFARLGNIPSINLLRQSNFP